MFQNILTSLFFLWICFSYIIAIVNADNNSCQYTEEIEQCTQENQHGAPRDITDFVCLQNADNERRIFQIILDKKFGEIDIEVENFLAALESGRDYYFGQHKQQNYLDGIKDIEYGLSAYGYFISQYTKLCQITDEDNIMTELAACLPDGMSVSGFSKFQNICIDLAQKKVSIYRQVAYKLLAYNKSVIYQDIQSDFISQQRTKYDELIDIMTVNMGYLSAIFHKWPTKTEDAYHS